MDISRRGFMRGCGIAAPALVGLGGLTAQPAYAEPTSSPRPAGLGDPVYPTVGNRGYRVDAYRIEVSYDEQAKRVDGVVTMTARLTEHLHELSLDAKSLAIKAVTVNERPRPFRLAEDKLIVELERVRPGRHIEVRTTYAADPRAVSPMEGGGFVPTDDGFAVVAQPVGARTVFPCNDHPSDKARYSFRISAPAGHLGVANGSMIRRYDRGGRTITEWRAREPMATELLQIAVGRFDIIDRGRPGGVHLRDVVPTARREQLEAALALTPGVVAWARTRMGEFPLEAYGLMPVNSDDPDAFDFTGLETQTLTAYKPGFLAQPEDQIGSHMMHEVIHSWWGNSVTPRDWSVLWLNEGHADFYGLHYRYERGWPDRMGYSTFVDRMKYTYAQGDKWRESSGPVAKPTAETLFDNQRYTGGVLVLYALEQRIGQKAFASLEREFVKVYRDKSVSTEQYIDAAVQVSGDAGVKGFLEDWLHGTRTPPMPGHPDWVVEPVVTGGASIQSRGAGVRTDRYGA